MSAAAVMLDQVHPLTSVDIRGLVIEDDDDLREALCGVLAALGIEARGLNRKHGAEELLAQQVMARSFGNVTSVGERGGVPVHTSRDSGAGLVLFTTRESAPEVAAEVPSPTEARVVRTIDLMALQQVLARLGHTLVPPAAQRTMPAAGELWAYDAALWKLVAPNGHSARLSAAESQVIRCLFERNGGVVSRDDLLTALNRPHLEACSRNLDVTVSRLRKKVEARCRQKLPLKSARGRGYLFDAPVVVLT